MTSESSRQTVLHVVAPARFGGLERVVCLLAAGQLERGRDVAVLAFLDEGQGDDHPFVHELRAHGISVDLVALPHRAYRAERQAVAAALRRLGPEVLHTHGSRVDVVDIPVARRAGVAAVSTVHGFVGGGLKARLYEVLHRRALRAADAVVAVSGPLVTDLARTRVPRSKIHLVRNAWRRTTTPMPRADARNLLGLEGRGGPVLGWVGRLSPEKGPDVFLDAIARLGGTELQAVIVGDGPDRESLRRQAEALGVADRVVWPGVVQEASRAFSAFDAFVLSSRTEGTPIALFEAVDAGVPVVATEVGGVPDVLGPEGGLLVPTCDPQALAAAIRSVLLDPEGAATKADRASARLSAEYGFDAWVDRYEAVYASAVRGCAARAAP